MALFSRLFGTETRKQEEPPPLLTPEQFADHYLKIVAGSAPEVEAQRDGRQVSMRWPDGGTTRDFLGNAYTQYRATPDALDDILAAQLASSRASAAPSEKLNLDLVLPLIKSRDWRATVDDQMQRAVSLVTRPLVHNLIVAFVQDLPDTISYVRDGELEGLCDAAALEARALSNLSARLPQLQVVGGNGRFRIELDGFFDASLILIADQWLGQLELEGDPVFAIPSRGQLLVGGSADSEAIASLADIAREITQVDAYAITDALLTLRDGAILPLTGER